MINHFILFCFIEILPTFTFVFIYTYIFIHFIFIYPSIFIFTFIFILFYFKFIYIFILFYVMFLSPRIRHAPCCEVPKLFLSVVLDIHPTIAPSPINGKSYICFPISTISSRPAETCSSWIIVYCFLNTLCKHNLQII